MPQVAVRRYGEGEEPNCPLSAGIAIRIILVELSAPRGISAPRLLINREVAASFLDTLVINLAETSHCRLLKQQRTDIHSENGAVGNALYKS